MRFLRNYWDKLFLLLILTGTGFLCFYGVGQDYSNQYYAATVKSMLTSWHNFFFASFDAGGFITVDKPALGFWLQAASAKLLGFHGWSLILPEALSAVLGVAVLYHIVKRKFGKAAGLISALAMGFTPILIAVSRSNNVDSSLLLVVLLAAWAAIVAAEKGKPRYLLLSMLLLGIGFNIKMLQAFLVLPGIVLIYLCYSPIKLVKRLLHLTAAAVLLVVVSLSWAVIVDLTPSENRPYVGSSTKNLELELALEYNGVERLTGNQNTPSGQKNNPSNGMSDAYAPPNNGNAGGFPGGNDGPPGGMPGSNGGPPNNGSFQPPNGSSDGYGYSNIPGVLERGNASVSLGGPGGVAENGEKGVFRIFNNNLGGQISWLLPMAVFGMLALFLRIKRQTGQEKRITCIYLMLFGTWVLLMVAFFSVAGFYHRYYLCMLAPGIASLAGIGVTELWREYRTEGGKWAWLPIALLATAAVQCIMLYSYEDWNKTLIPYVGGICLAAALVLCMAHIGQNRSHKTAKIITGIALVALLTAPALWSYTPIRYGTDANLPVAGPELQQEDDALTRNGETRTSVSTALVTYLLEHYGGEQYLVAVPDATQAAAIYLQTNKAVMATGGFTGNDKALSLAKLQELVSKGQLRYFMASERNSNSEILEWVKESGTVVQYDNAEDGNYSLGDRIGTGVLYDLSPKG